VFLDLVGFSVIFPLFPAMLRHYLATEGSGGLFAELIRVLGTASGSDADMRLAVLFGGLLGSAYSFLQFLFAPVWGGLSDRLGRRPVLLITLGGMTASYLLWFFSGNFVLFVGSRLLAGVMSGNISVATAAMADATTAANRSKGMGLVGAAFGLGFILGPALGGVLSMAKIGGGPVTAGDPAPAVSWLNPFAAVAAGAFLLSFSNWIWVALKFAETLAPEDRSKGRREGRTINPLQLFGRQEFPGVRRTNILWFVYLLGFSGMEFSLTFLAADRFGYTPRQNAYLFVFSGLILVFVQGGMIRRLAPLYGERMLAVTGLALIVPGFLLIGLVPRQGSLYLGLALVSVGSALLTPSATALVSLYATADRQGSVLGVFRSLGALARALGPIGTCFIYWRLGSSFPYLAGSVLMLLPLALAAGLPRPARHDGA